jgi:hypothetical protein
MFTKQFLFIGLKFTLCVLAVGGVTSGIAHSHGIPLKTSSYDTNQLYGTKLVAYDPVESQLATTDTNLKGAAGFYPDPERFLVGRQLTVDSTGSAIHPTALLFWNGSNVLPSPVSITLQRTGINVTVGPTDTFVHVGTLPAFNGLPGGHSALNVLLPLGSPVGLYALGFQVTSPGSPDFGRSETFWGVANNGLTSPGDVQLGLAAIQSAVPEPSSVVLATLGAAALGFFRWRRSR